jgi:hypothetical protein
VKAQRGSSQRGQCRALTSKQEDGLEMPNLSQLESLLEPRVVISARISGQVCDLVFTWRSFLPDLHLVRRFWMGIICQMGCRSCKQVFDTRDLASGHLRCWNCVLLKEGPCVRMIRASPLTVPTMTVGEKGKVTVDSRASLCQDGSV